MPRRNREGAWLDEGVLRDAEVLRKLVDDGRYLAIDCTEFAKSAALSPDVLEGKDRIEGELGLGAALKAGRAQLDFAERPFRFAIDLAVLRDRDAFTPYDPPLAGNSSPFRVRLERLIEDERLFGGRDDELRWPDNAIDTMTSGYVFITGHQGRQDGASRQLDSGSP